MVVPPVGAGRSFKALKNTVVTKKSDARPNRRYRLDEHPPHVERELPGRLRLHHAVPPRVFLTIFLLTLTIMSFNMEVNYKPDGRPRPSRGPCPEGHRPAARREPPHIPPTGEPRSRPNARKAIETIPRSNVYILHRTCYFPWLSLPRNRRMTRIWIRSSWRGRNRATIAPECISRSSLSASSVFSGRIPLP